MHNALRHADATQIVLRLRRQAQRVEVSVTDNGRGMRDVPDGHRGTGLAGMRQRAHLLGGDCSIQPHGGGGTVVTCWVPSAEPARDTKKPSSQPRGGGSSGGAGKPTPTR